MIQERIARIARDELSHHRYASVALAGEAMAAAIIAELPLAEECELGMNPNDYGLHWDHLHRWVTEYAEVPVCH